MESYTNFSGTTSPSSSGIGLAITGVGAAAPTEVLSNQALSELVETSDEWISTRTGIRHRHLASAQSSLAHLATTAGQKALAQAGLVASDLDLIILATSTPDDLFGSAGLVQFQLGATRAVAFDLTAACSGFVFGLVTAAQFLRSGTYQNILLIGADMLSRWVDWSDRRTCVLFGDGAGAVVLQANHRDRLLGFELRSDGSQNGCLNLAYQAEERPLTAGVSVGQGNYQPITMNGQEVYRFAVKQVPEVIEKALFKADLSTERLDWLLLHQANQRILDAVAQRLHLPSQKVMSNLADYGNTSAASIPLALAAEVEKGTLKPDHTIAMAGFGAGLSWGAAVVAWGR
jgi:3-oxoacyl-[acyl-carrier-protein] synthase III